MFPCLEDNYGYLLFRAIEATKCKLSKNEEALIRFEEGKLQISEPIRREEFDAIIEEDVAKISGSVDEVLKKANLSAEQIDTVFLTGGSSHIPMIQNLFAGRFGQEKMKHSDAFTSVAYGMGLSCGHLG